jgi:hypothetical protein
MPAPGLLFPRRRLSSAEGPCRRIGDVIPSCLPSAFGVSTRAIATGSPEQSTGAAKFTTGSHCGQPESAGRSHRAIPRSISYPPCGRTPH